MTRSSVSMSQVLEGMIGIAGSARGQMASAVLAVLLAWAVLTKRIYIVEMTGGQEGVLNELMGLLGLTEVEAKDVDTFEEEGEEAEIEAEEEVRRSSLGLKRRESSEGIWLTNPPPGAETSRRWRLEATAPGIESTPQNKKIKPYQVHGLAGFSARNARTKRLESKLGSYWSEPDEKGFRIRGATYLMDKVKVPVTKPLFHLLDCDLFDLPVATNHLGRYLDTRLQALWKDSGLLLPGKKPYTVIIQLQVPGPPWKSFCMYFGCPDRDLVFTADTPFSRIARRFFANVHTTINSGDPGLHKWRNNTFKLIPRCVNAPFVVKRAVGEVPTLLGNKLQQAYYGTDSYFEVDVNISSSRIAQYTVGLALNYASVVVCDLAFVLQGASPAELPEELVGCMRIEHIVMRDSMVLDIPSNDPNALSS